MPRPTEADFGFFASMFRHFACDPAPGRVMRTRAPAVFEWVARMWNLNPARVARAPLPDELPTDLGALLELVTSEYLPYLEANARAFAAGDARVRYALRGVAFDEPTKPYRVWCRDRLQRALAALPRSERATVERVVAAPDALERLALPSPKHAESVIQALPIPPAARRAPVDSWWRPARGAR